MFTKWRHVFSLGERRVGWVTLRQGERESILARIEEELHWFTLYKLKKYNMKPFENMNIRGVNPSSELVLGVPFLYESFGWGGLNCSDNNY